MGGKDVATPLGVTLAVQAMVSMSAVTVPVLAANAAPDVGVAATGAGIYVSLMYVGGMVSSVWSGPFIHRFGGVRVSQACLVLAGIGLMVTAFASLAAMIASAFIIGFGYGPVTPASSHILARTTPPGMRSFVFSLKQTGVPLGGALAGGIVPTLVEAVGWKSGAVMVGTVSLALVVLIHPVRALLDDDRSPQFHISFRGVCEPLFLVVTRQRLRRLALISFFFAGMQMCVCTYLVIYLTKDIGMAFVAAGFTLSAALLAGTFGRIVWGVVADRFLRPPLLLGLLGVGMSSGAIATALMTPAWSISLILAVVILFGATAIGWNGVYLAEAARLAPVAQVGDATGATLFFTFLGVVLGPPIFAVIAMTTDSYPLGFVFFSALTLLGGAVAVCSGGERYEEAAKDLG